MADFPFVDMTWLDSDGKYHMLSESLLLKWFCFCILKGIFLILTF